jgi:murein DD-endopeptidase MepM/ murein hydrolase activator NlpD
MAIDKNKFLKKLKNKYRLTIYNDSTLQEVWTFYMTRLNVFTYVGMLFILNSIIVILLFIFTPLKAFLPAYTDSKLKREIVKNALRADSLEQELNVRNLYFENIKNIMQGKEIKNFNNIKDSAKHFDNIKFTKSKHDSLLRNQIEKEEQNNLTMLDRKQGKLNFNNLQFYMPVKGIITNKFNTAEGHLGIDIVSGPNQPIMAVLEGTVIISQWSLQTGYLISIQHDNNLISIYMHNSALLKNVGDHVEAGESIAIIGNTGELTTGPHLHFELWHNGTPVNPENYIAF